MLLLAGTFLFLSIFPMDISRGLLIVNTILHDYN